VSRTLKLANRTWTRIWTFLLLVLLSVVDAGAEVRVYYFHSTARCTECLQIEELIGESLREVFPKELTDGRLTWRPTNADLSENAHFVFDYDLAANELVVVRDTSDRTNGWNKLPEVWKLVHNPELFRTELVNMVSKALATVD
jgi:hypothetical protein